jgi:hypothetical protein
LIVFGPGFDEVTQLTLIFGNSSQADGRYETDLYLVLKSKKTSSFGHDAEHTKNRSTVFNVINAQPTVSRHAFVKVVRVLGLKPQEPKFMLVHVLSVLP